MLATLVLTFAGLQEDFRSANVGVLGNKVEPSSVPSPNLASRQEKNVQLYRRGLFPKVIVSGGLVK